MRLICCPYAGGSAQVYRDWPSMLPEWIEVWAVEPPGRGMRFREPLLRTVKEHVQSLSQAVAPLLDRPYAVFGHSMGAIVGFELARALRARHLPAPRRLFVSGSAAPTLPRRRELIHGLPDDLFLEAIAKFNGCPKDVLADRELLELFLPVLRADFVASETHAHTPEPSLRCPITAFYGTADPDTLEAEVRAWREQTASEFVLKAFPGDHFFVRSHAGSVLSDLVSNLREVSDTKRIQVDEA